MTYMMQLQEKTARARADNVPVSSKQCVEICTFLRGKELDKAITILENVIDEKQAIPFRRFTNGVGHRPGMAAGRYPVKASSEILVLLENVKANATTQGLTGTLNITHLSANRASRPVRNRLKYRGEFKRTHLEVVVAETQPAKKPAEKKPAVPSEIKEEKPVEKKIPSKEPVKKAPVKTEPTPKKTDVTPKPEAKNDGN